MKHFQQLPPLYGEELSSSLRPDNCLPRRVREILKAMRGSDAAAYEAFVGAQNICSIRGHCEIGEACRRILGAFTTAMPKEDEQPLCLSNQRI